jgi:CRP/FNR family transcriptional regulator
VSTIDILSKVELFSELPTKDLTRLAKLTVARQFKKGELIVKEGETAIAFYIVSKGKVEVVKGAGSKKETVLATMGPGNFFGEMALFDNHPRSASVRAVEDTEVLVLTKWDFNAELNTPGSRLAHSLLPILARRIRAAGEDATH